MAAYVQQIRNCTSTLSLSHTYCAFIVKHQNYSLRNYTREFAETTQEEYLCPTKLLHKAINGRTYKKKHKSM